MVELIYFLIYLFIFIFGICIGSFLNVVIYRLPLGIMMQSERSYCPKCQAQIKNYDLIPLFSFLFLKGRCRACGEKISPRYPLVEFLIGIIAVLSIYTFEYSAKAFVAFAFCCLLISISLIKFDANKSPIILNILLFATTIANIVLNKTLIIYNVIPAILIAILLVICFIKKWNFKTFSFILFNISIFLPIKILIVFSVLLCVLIIAVRLICKRKGNFSKMLYHSVYFAFILALFFGDVVVKLFK